MAESGLWIKCTVVVVILGYISIQFMRYMDDWYRQEFRRYLETEQKRNPHLFEP